MSREEGHHNQAHSRKHFGMKPGSESDRPRLIQVLWVFGV
ncbi:hypothetical protein CMEL01_05220 [Colletotrichum melonis]|uniref:Uncharacterized protein n=3 Tax=Colletotrichum acutatum species complex TaxID=2707335 RepID=A0AAI9Z978_9PEZI|nr:uncharacterized protein CCOS01_00525 [Colletotrichum costaricense]XP_060377245.1 uncharacterized protein CTAM01_12105 [Colletotrichum tamarilloi]KAK1453561.1 hypothetical protein CMEL01_05220 [Colletotrichum melonis]KAK1486672.1 hypothetical protein CTAM01_12105 [Colletotrichum tamarilloi]KAK1539211.1 hypothetical protein CCOS01_00525 [Colletotrichum costaricense]